MVEHFDEIFKRLSDAAFGHLAEDYFLPSREIPCAVTAVCVVAIAKQSTHGRNDMQRGAHTRFREIRPSAEGRTQFLRRRCIAVIERSATQGRRDPSYKILFNAPLSHRG